MEVAEISSCPVEGWFVEFSGWKPSRSWHLLSDLMEIFVYWSLSSTCGVTRSQQEIARGRSRLQLSVNEMCLGVPSHSLAGGLQVSGGCGGSIRRGRKRKMEACAVPHLEPIRIAGTLGSKTSKFSLFK